MIPSNVDQSNHRNEFAYHNSLRIYKILISQILKESFAIAADINNQIS